MRSDIPPVTPGRPRLLTVREAARELTVSTRTIWRFLGEGKLPRVQFGRSVRVPADAVDAFIARGGSR